MEGVQSVKQFTKGLVRHRVLVIVLCLALIVPSILGMAATKTKYDLLYYLPQDLETVKGQEILLEDFGKGAFSLLVTEGMTIQEQADMENAVRDIPHVDSVIGFASLTRGQFPLEIIPEDLRSRFSRGDCMLSAVFFDEGSSSEDTMAAIQQVRKTAGEKCFQGVRDMMKGKETVDMSDLYGEHKDLNEFLQASPGYTSDMKLTPHL